MHDSSWSELKDVLSMLNKCSLPYMFECKGERERGGGERERGERERERESGKEGYKDKLVDR